MELKHQSRFRTTRIASGQYARIAEVRPLTTQVDSLGLAIAAWDEVSTQKRAEEWRRLLDRESKAVTKYASIKISEEDYERLEKIRSFGSGVAHGERLKLLDAVDAALWAWGELTKARQQRLVDRRDAAREREHAA